MKVFSFNTVTLNEMFSLDESLAVVPAQRCQLF